MNTDCHALQLLHAQMHVFGFQLGGVDMAIVVLS
jgi:hypothetical protein